MHTPGVPIFKIQGELHHFIGSLIPRRASDPIFLQAYVADNTLPQAMELRLRHANRYGVERNTLEILTAMLYDSNPLVGLFVTAQERLRQAGGSFNVILSTIEPHARDSRRYNRPTAAEVGMIVADNDQPAMGHHRDIIVQHTDVASAESTN